MKRLVFFILISLPLFSCHAKYHEDQNRHKIALFGGSIAVHPEANVSKSYWSESLSIAVDTYAKRGAGFSDWRDNTIIGQVERANGYKYYLLWCSTNDYGQPIEIDGEPYSTKSQNGGIRNVIRTIIANYPAAAIIAFTSLPSIDGRDMSAYVKAQIDVFEQYNIPYLDQFHFFDGVNIAAYYNIDQQHILPEGYLFIRDRQLNFLKLHLAK